MESDMATAFIETTGAVSVRLVDADIERCVHSRFNTRKHRDPEQVRRLAERIRRNGFERTRSLWGVEVHGQYEIFAGGTRLEAARLAGLRTVPVFVHLGLTEDQISRKADEDNENDEYHTPVSPLDVWAECYRLSHEEGWTQQRIADAKGWSRPDVANRIRLHQALPERARQAVLDGLFDEGHCQAVMAVVLDVQHFSIWLTTEQAQSELVEEILAKHRGQSAGVKPTVKVVREAAKRWQALIQAAQDAYESLPEGPWRDRFVEVLAHEQARTESAVSRALRQVVERKRRQEEAEAARLRAEADAKEQEALRLQREQQRLAFLESQTKKLRCGDAREWILEAPPGFSLLLTDPPYGVEFQSHRRVVTPKKAKIAGDEKHQALDLLRDVLAKAYPRMADNATCLVFTGWRHEPEFRQVLEEAGFTLKGSLIWVKPNHGTGDLAGCFAPKHERILHAVKGQPRLRQRVPDVLYGNDPPGSEHPCEKPRDLLRQLIEAVTEPGQTVVDPFMGCGNTILEAYQAGRDFFGIDLEPQWHRVATEAVHKLAEAHWRHEELEV